MSVNFDPLASMRCWAVEIELGAETVTVPALPAADWWPVLASGNPASVLDLATKDASVVDGLLLSGALRGEDADQALRDAIEAGTGRSFHVAVVLVMLAERHWTAIGGAIAQAGFRWDVAPIGAALDLVYSLVLQMAKDEESAKRIVDILEDESLTDPEKKGPSKKAVSDFEAMAGPMPTTGVLSTGEQSGSGLPRSQPRPRPRRRADP